MYAIISELDYDASVMVKNLWARLRDACGLTAIYEFPTPHFTWFAAESIDRPVVTALVADLTARTQCLTILASGLGIFCGEKPVIYLPLVKTQEMIELHDWLWTQIEPHSEQKNKYYAPNNWMPHITLAINVVSRESLKCALETIAFEPIEMRFSVDNLIVVTQEDDPSSMILERFQCNG